MLNVILGDFNFSSLFIVISSTNVKYTHLTLLLSHLPTFAANLVQLNMSFLLPVLIILSISYLHKLILIFLSHVNVAMPVCLPDRSLVSFNINYLPCTNMPVRNTWTFIFSNCNIPLVRYPSTANLINRVERVQRLFTMRVRSITNLP